MTYEEAKKIMISAMCRVNDMPPSVVEAFRMYQDAFEKQIPKKIVKGNAFRELGFCPNCNEPIKSRTSFKSSVGKIYISWCSECGQAVDWREEEVKR